ncbi:MAG: heme exporter protein CcmB [Longimonas sp.]|uniref:heme exporter protein CcmB n=1 Tax=Longimonas sp. TaxID=2039626 RepID=UPI003974A98D
MTDWLAGTWAVFQKDVQIELRQRVALNMLGLFVLATLALVLFAVGQETLSPAVQSALLWIVILFSASIGLGRTFVSEAEAGTLLLLQLHVRGSMVFAGKLLFTVLLVLGLNALAVALFVLMLDVSVAAPDLLVGVLVLGALGLSGATTLLGALIARATQRGPLLPVLLLPVLMPLLLSVVEATRIALTGGTWRAAQDEVLTLIGFTGTTITAAVLLFDYVWQE